MAENTHPQLHDAVAIITGGAGGQGAAEARLFLERGAAAVVITDFNAEAGEHLAAELGERASFVTHDVSSPDDWARVVEHTLSAHGRIDTLVNNAGILRMLPLSEETVEGLDKILSVNVRGVFLGMQAVAPAMRERGSGAIINVSSLAGIQGQANATAYSASKFAVRGLTRSAALELGPFGVRVNSVHPGTILTPMIGDLGAAADHFPFAALGRAGRAEEVATLVAFLASNDASYITGGEYMVDGGSAAGDPVQLSAALSLGIRTPDAEA
ncbi:glucose 1-dehydrogenase [Leucobacter luti]|uniref:3alpha(Or 20beta)-hydroxysteroid dehydrogenase n=1 Tax=Leucobacter luti TaxID=340320 RepID=A0A4Q7U7I4_9MICO|nr:glucose 1-dehydrogenase [Leucobacter luti]MBL3700989.1 glucose 1-dehydrogenase [Leucobacter luti]RZT68790.1 3alpha(or 20beta)-hydroxysteroid dehydrogenase [Leucobacter luti]